MKMVCWRKCATLGALLLITAAASLAQQSDDAAELAKKLQNPVAALISVPAQSNFEWGGGPGSEGFKFTLNVQPVIPITLTDDWNLISRTIVPIIHQDDVIPDSSQSGIGDILQSAFFSPQQPGPGGIIWVQDPPSCCRPRPNAVSARKSSASVRRPYSCDNSRAGRTASSRITSCPSVGHIVPRT